jgi:hypothetical protein
LCAGSFVVPVNALIQSQPLPEFKGRVIGVAANLLSFGGIALQPVVQYDAATRPSRRRLRISNLRRSVFDYGFCVGANAGGIVAERTLLDAVAAEG